MLSADRIINAINENLDFVVLNPKLSTCEKYHFTNNYHLNHCKNILEHQARLIELHMADTRRFYDLKQINQGIEALKAQAIINRSK